MDAFSCSVSGQRTVQVDPPAVAGKQQPMSNPLPPNALTAAAATRRATAKVATFLHGAQLATEQHDAAGGGEDASYEILTRGSEGDLETIRFSRICVGSRQVGVAVQCPLASHLPGSGLEHCCSQVRVVQACVNSAALRCRHAIQSRMPVTMQAAPMLCGSGPLQASQRVAIIGGGCDPWTHWLALTCNTRQAQLDLSASTAGKRGTCCACTYDHHGAAVQVSTAHMRSCCS